MYQYTTEQFLPVSISKAWDFFSSPKNLSLITPPEMHFKILTRLEDYTIFEGMHIDYIVKPVLGIPFRWKTEIGKTLPFNYFVDKQLSGPYSSWEHQHTFIEKNGGVLMKDEISYKMPLGYMGIIAHKLFVRRKIERIFNYRRNMLNKIFSENGISNN